MDKLRGYEIEEVDGEYVFCDTGEKTSTTYTQRPCGHCDKFQTKEGHDGCLGTLPGVFNACCGHGETKDAYIQYMDKTTIHGEEATAILKILKKIRKLTRPARIKELLKYFKKENKK